MQNSTKAAKTLATNLVGQRFIFKRGFSRWAMHFLIMWGCVLSALITFPLVFGWVHFKLEGELGYREYVRYDFPVNEGRLCKKELQLTCRSIIRIVCFIH